MNSIHNDTQDLRINVAVPVTELSHSDMRNVHVAYTGTSGPLRKDTFVPWRLLVMLHHALPASLEGEYIHSLRRLETHLKGRDFNK